MDNGVILNAGNVVGTGISNVEIDDNWNFVITYTNGEVDIIKNIETELKDLVNNQIEDLDLYTKDNIDNFLNEKIDKKTGYSLISDLDQDKLDNLDDNISRIYNSDIEKLF